MALLKKVVQEVKLVISLPRAIRDMQGEVTRLIDVTHDINVELAQLQMNPKSIVKVWLDKAGEAIERSGSIGSDYEQQKNCLIWCPNCVCRYRIGRRIRDWKASVVQLLSQRESDFPPSWEYGDPVQNPESGSGLVLDTRRSQQMELVERLLSDEDSSIRRIGIQGMGGVGKTSMLDAINDSQRVRDAFDLIIKVTVSKNHILDIQNSVADRLNLKGFKENSNFEERKEMLRSFLKNKKYLLLLDDMWAVDMWTSDELQELGVSLDDTGFKILLTARDKEVCARMNMQETITVEPLLEQEGWELFHRRAFQNRNGNVPPEIEKVAREFAKECKGLPLAIIVVAAAMAHHTELYEWESALDQMKNVPETFYGLHAGVDKRLFQRLQWNYDVLQPDELKVCFLYFAAYPEDKVIYVREVKDMWISEGLVKVGRDSYLDDIGHSYIKQLADRCLIEVAGRDSVGRIFSVKIHDVLRNLAIRIGEKEHRCYFKAGLGVSHFPSQEDLQDCAKLSLMNNNLQSLPTTFPCLSLSVLLLRDNPDIKEVPESFLNELPSLRVLDLSKTGITSLPPSIGNLKYLASLQLQHTGIRELPESIGDLKELQFLNVSFCFQLLCLPKRIPELKSLRALDIRGCEGLRQLPRGISELVSLERLRMLGSSIRLEFEAAANEETGNSCLKDLQSLRRLRVLWVGIKSPVKEGVMGNWSNMRDLLLEFEDASGQDYLPQDMKEMKHLESLSLWNCDVERLPDCDTQFRKLACLCLIECKRLKELPSELPCLRVLCMDKCDQLKELDLGMGFPKLREMTLLNLKSLECVGPGGAARGSGGLGEGVSLPPMLKSIDVRGCPKLKSLRGTWDNLNHLEAIRGNREWWDAIEWDDPNMKSLLENKLKVYTFKWF